MTQKFNRRKNTGITEKKKILRTRFIDVIKEQSFLKKTLNLQVMLLMKIEDDETRMIVIGRNNIITRELWIFHIFQYYYNNNNILTFCRVYSSIDN